MNNYTDFLNNIPFYFYNQGLIYDYPWKNQKIVKKPVPDQKISEE